MVSAPLQGASLRFQERSVSTVIEPLRSSGSLVITPRPLAQPVEPVAQGAVVVKPEQRGPLKAGIGSQIDLSA